MTALFASHPAELIGSVHQGARLVLADKFQRVTLVEGPVASNFLVQEELTPHTLALRVAGAHTEQLIAAAALIEQQEPDLRKSSVSKLR